MTSPLSLLREGGCITVVNKSLDLLTSVRENALWRRKMTIVVNESGDLLTTMFVSAAIDVPPCVVRFNFRYRFCGYGTQQAEQPLDLSCVAC